MQNIRNLVHTVQGKVHEVTEKVSEKVSGHPKEAVPAAGTTTGQSTGLPTQEGSTSTTTSSSSTMGNQQLLSNVNVEHVVAEKKFFIRTPNNPDCYLEYTMMNEAVHGKNCVDLAFIFVPQDLRHIGYGSKLATEFLNWARLSNYCIHINPQVRQFFVDTVLNTNEYKNGGWCWNSTDNIVEQSSSVTTSTTIPGNVNMMGSTATGTTMLPGTM